MGSGSVGATVEESSAFLSVAVEIDHHFYLFLLMSVHDLILDEVNLWIELFRRGFPSSIEVSSD
jgi:hypothetical protein